MAAVGMQAMSGEPRYDPPAEADSVGVPLRLIDGSTVNVEVVLAGHAHCDGDPIECGVRAMQGEYENLRAIVADAPHVMEPPRWGRHHATHMKGWEAFGVVPGTTPTVRQLGMFYGGGKPGTEKWGPGEVKLGVAGIEFITSADCPEGAYLYVLGTEKDDVERRWHLAAGLWIEMGERLWPTSR